MKKTDTIIDNLNLNQTERENLVIDLKRLVSKNLPECNFFNFFYMNTNEIGWPSGMVSADNPYTLFLCGLHIYDEALDKIILETKNTKAKQQLKDYQKKHKNLTNKALQSIGEIDL